MTIITKLDYTLVSVEERLALVNQILSEVPDPTPNYLEILANYLIVPIEKAERRERKILTENRLATVNKREISYEGLVAQLENGEDGIYNLINESKTTIFQPKVTITKKDVEEIPPLRQVREAIKIWEEKQKTAVGRDAFVIKKAIIELRKDQYIIKNAYRVPVAINSLTKPSRVCALDDSFTFDKNGFIVPEGISLCDSRICSAILCNYAGLRQESYGRFDTDLWCLMEDFERIKNKALENFPLYQEIVDCKVNGLQNLEIQKQLQEKFNTTHSLEYISSLWRNKIPGMIASVAEDELLDYYYLNEEKGKYKRCSRCGQIKLAHNKYFSKNKTSKDGFYSICKACRNQKINRIGTPGITIHGQKCIIYNI